LPDADRFGPVTVNVEMKLKDTPDFHRLFGAGRLDVEEKFRIAISGRSLYLKTVGRQLGGRP